ncbi:MAG: oxidase, partial [Rhodospirillaceae bacterium]|nr:oxidase [Rhodospirillaceae bacterium]
GSGPLLLAIGAELTATGNPPVAIVEAARPFQRPWRALRLPSAYIREAAGYATRLFRASVPIVSGAKVKRICRPKSGIGLSVSYVDARGEPHVLGADLIGLHDGLQSNSYGISEVPGLILRMAGDCRELLGARAAEMDGLRIGAEVRNLLRSTGASEPVENSLDHHRRAQAVLNAIYAVDSPDPSADLPDDTVICRCENKTAADLRALQAPTLREARLIGRFAMGPCQGRFCGQATRSFLGAKATAPLIRNRWPIAPMPIRSIIDAEIPELTQHETERSST